MIKASNAIYLLTDLWKIPIREGKPQKLAVNAHGARWLGDSKRIVYLSLVDAGHSDIYVIDTDGSNVHQVVQGDHAPVFPVGNDSIMFVKDRSLWEANVDTKAVSEANLLVNLTREARRGSNVCLPSSDGEKVAYIEDRTLFALNVEDGARIQIADEVSEGTLSKPNLVWSWFGYALAYTNFQRPTCLWIYTLDDSALQKLVCGD
jgi:Tol biopolymer transport system component